MTLPTPSVLAQLVRLPAVLSVPGDAWLGTAAARRSLEDGPPRRALAMPVASALIYLGGMALNDWADREQDAVERPERPIPSGAITPGQALAVGAGLVATGVGVAGAVGGAPALAVAVPLAGSVVLYDLLAKDTSAGPAVMAVCRGLDVLLGAAGTGAAGGTIGSSAVGSAVSGALADAVGSPFGGTVPRHPIRNALPAAGLIAVHTATVTAVSQHEVSGAPPVVPGAAAAATCAIALASAALGMRRLRPPALLLPSRPQTLRRVATAAAASTYAMRVGDGYLRAARQGGDAGAIRQAVGGGVMGIIPLQSTLLAGAGALARAAVVAAAIPIGSVLRRKREVT